MAIDYSQIIQTLIKEQASLHKSGDVRVETIFDTEHHHYLLVQVGWQEITGYIVLFCT